MAARSKLITTKFANVLIEIDQPTKLKDFVQKDQTMRLLVGAESGDAEEYGYAEITITPGKKVCAIYSYEDAQVVIIKDTVLE